MRASAADIEQPRLGLLEPRRIERQRVGGARDPVLGFARFDQRPVERRQRLGEQRMVGRAALDPPRRLAKLRERAVRPAEQLVEAGQRFAGLEPGLHRRALLGEAGLLAFLGRQRLDLAAGMVEPFAVALGGGGFGARLGQLGLDPRRPRPRPLRPAPASSLPNASSSARWPLGLSRPRSSCWPWISTASAPMSRSSPAGTAAPPTKARLPPSLFSVRRTISGSPGSISMPCSREQRDGPGGPAGSSISADTAAASWPAADQPGVGARAERQAERVEQDRFAGAGLAGEHAEARLELELEPLDEHDIVDGELPQHATSRAARASLCVAGRLLRRAAGSRSSSSSRSDCRYQ